MKKIFSFGILSLCLLFFATAAHAQQKNLAIILSGDSPQTLSLADLLGSSLSSSFRLSDSELVHDVVSASPEKELFNLSLESARHIGTGIGCDYFIVLRSEDLRRSSFKKDIYYEAYLTAFFVDARTGKLLGWKYFTAEADEAAEAQKSLISSFKEFLPEIPEIIARAAADEKKEIFDTSVYDIKDDSAGVLRTPLPFRRISPSSTPLAQHLRTESTVDIEVAIDVKGFITQTRIVRWAGLGLDEAVTETVRKMNFRPAILDGKAIPARFLLRYKFRIPADDKKSN